MEISGAFGPVYDAERFGSRLVASPRYADALLVTGVVGAVGEVIPRRDPARPHGAGRGRRRRPFRRPVGGARVAVFVLTPAGFGSKAGLLRLHAWLPRAHPEAPSLNWVAWATSRGPAVWLPTPGWSIPPWRCRSRRSSQPAGTYWPALPVAMANTIVPDFPLTNKSFNQSYAGNDL